MPCEPCKKKSEQRAADARVTKPAEPAEAKGYKVTDKTTTDRSKCPHGVAPWYNCTTCAEESTYQFKGNFR